MLLHHGRGGQVARGVCGVSRRVCAIDKARSSCVCARASGDDAITQRQTSARVCGIAKGGESVCVVGVGEDLRWPCPWLLFLGHVFWRPL